MSENKKSDHWGVLAAELGAEPAPEEPKAASEPTAPPSEADIGEAPPQPRSAPPPARPRKSASDWNRLAESLGVEVPPEEVPAAPLAAEPTEPAAVGEPTRPEASSLVSPPARREAGREHLQRREDRAREPRGDDRGDRRRRKHHRRSQEGGRQAPRRFDEPRATRPAAETTDQRDTSQEPSEARSAEAPARVRTAGEEAPRSRDKRRRRRRGGPRPEFPAAELPSPDVGELPPEQAAVDLPEKEDLELDEDDLDDVGEPLEAPGEAAAIEDRGSESGSRGEKSLHRAIPSWGEAVNIIIAANLEARAKNPERRPGARPHGGHERKGRDSGSERTN